MEQDFTASTLRCSKCGEKTHTLIYSHDGNDAFCSDCLPPIVDENFQYEYNPMLKEIQEIKSLLKEMLQILKT